MNINSKVSRTSLLPVSLSNQPLSHHWFTWFWPSHSVYDALGGRSGVSFWGWDTVYQPTAPI